MDVTLEMSALAFLEQAEVKELVRPSQQSWLDSSRPTLITCRRARPGVDGQGAPQEQSLSLSEGVIITERILRLQAALHSPPFRPETGCDLIGMGLSSNLVRLPAQGDPGSIPGGQRAFSECSLPTLRVSNG